ncbi:LuxR C-terminal-related transcriptional regulator [Aquimarina sp. 2201CG5-10]|uniref:LuxR C-terminal-related transcriptional regulator n=1 Tax=Aquimarina callyspongiae TaxID=3098150 RepID=UPI002AB4F582|nr:LuxR C-terminal-related transcriptional regulator [Aquimarina sp. 2201CG5-10]MDY8134753.1 LuxR C-terminal-related transcriptional regulator [Aquimarina sp. 2201CG5-10]
MNRFLIIIYFLGFSTFSQTIENKALPWITHYDTRNMGFNAQSWDIEQDENGVIYIANGNQILIYDGTEWNTFGMNTGQINRSLFVKNKDTIYFGADGIHGLLINQGYTDYKIQPLKNNNKNVVADIEEYWKTHYINKEVVFQTFRNLYINEGNIITKIPAPYRFKWSYNIGDKLYVNDLKYGVFRLEETNLIPIVSDPQINENIIGVTNVEDDLIIITDTKGLFKLQEGKLIPITFSTSEEIKKAQIFSFLKLRDDRIAIGTVSNGLYILDVKTGKTENLNKKNGLQNNTILSIFQDDESNLWLALDYGIDYLKLNSPLTYFYDYYGELGTVYAVLKKGNLTYLGTNQGLYVIDEENPEFELLLNGQVWNIEELGDKIFVGHDMGAFELSGKSLVRIGEDLGAWNFIKYEDSNLDEIFLSGNYNGISLYQKNQNTWEAYVLEGFEKSCRYIEVDTYNNIWLGLRSEGVFKCRLNYEDKKLENLEFYPISDFGGEVLSLSQVENNIVVTSDYHSYTYSNDNNTFKKLKLGVERGQAPRIFKNENQIWYLDNDKVVLENEKGITNLHELKDQLIPDVLDIFSLDEKNMIIPVFNGFSMFENNSKTQITGVNNDLLIRDFVSVNSEKSYLSNAQIPFSDNDLKISYALPIYGEEISYQTKINDNTWSDWTTATEQTLFNLKEGDYKVNIRAKYKGSIKETVIDFKVLPPIYRTSWAYFFYFLLSISLILAVIAINRYKMKKQERILLEQKAEKLKKQEEKYRTQKLSQERKIIELNNSKLQDEIKAKSRELTQIAYVNLNKNKILKKIRERIIKVQESSSQKLPTNSYNELVRLVEYYITDKESKLFEINFDKSHQEFYERLSKNYPNLTSKDLRLCAYLKMNLSSKEIAPLLGISSQSVDVSRHRLRKKLNLGSKDNLTNILISLK